MSLRTCSSLLCAGSLLSFNCRSNCRARRSISTACLWIPNCSRCGAFAVCGTERDVWQRVSRNVVSVPLDLPKRQSWLPCSWMRQPAAHAPLLTTALPLPPHIKTTREEKKKRKKKKKNTTTCASNRDLPVSARDKIRLVHTDSSSFG